MQSIQWRMQPIQWRMQSIRWRMQSIACNRSGVGLGGAARTVLRVGFEGAQSAWLIQIPRLADVSLNYRWVARQPDGSMRMHAQSNLIKREGAAPVRYTRIYVLRL
jgi:hypothetical protein